MKIKYDDEADCLYIDLEVGDGSEFAAVLKPWHNGMIDIGSDDEIRPMVTASRLLIDVGKNSEVRGIEIMMASDMYPQAFLERHKL